VNLHRCISSRFTKKPCLRLQLVRTVANHSNCQLSDQSCATLGISSVIFRLQLTTKQLKEQLLFTRNSQGGAADVDQRKTADDHLQGCLHIDCICLQRPVQPEATKLWQ